MGRWQDADRLLGHAIALRGVIERLEGYQDTERGTLECVVDELMCQLGPTVPKRVAARALGVHVSTLDRYIASGHLDTGGRPHSSHQEIGTEMSVELGWRLNRSRSRAPDALRQVIGELWQNRLDDRLRRESSPFDRIVWRRDLPLVGGD